MEYLKKKIDKLSEAYIASTQWFPKLPEDVHRYYLKLGFQAGYEAALKEMNK